MICRFYNFSFITNSSHCHHQDIVNGGGDIKSNGEGLLIEVYLLTLKLVYIIFTDVGGEANYFPGAQSKGIFFSLCLGN